MIILNDRKRHVLLTAQQLFVEKGYITTSIQDILDAAKISKGTFYNYFSSKNECLKAILELGRDETMIRRRELLIGQDASDKKVLAGQITIRQEVNRDHNLLPIFEAIFHSDDPDLRAFAKKYHIAELAWLSNRLVDVYGNDAAPYVPDCAVLMFGMLQHMTHIRSASTEGDIDIEELVNFTLRRMDSIMPTMIETADRLINHDIFRTLDETTSKTKQQLQLLLTDFNDSLADADRLKSRQYIEFIIDELNSEHPRVFLLETVTRSFRETFIGSPEEHKAQALASALWTFLDTLEKGN